MIPCGGTWGDLLPHLWCLFKTAASVIVSTWSTLLIQAKTKTITLYIPYKVKEISLFVKFSIGCHDRSQHMILNSGRKEKLIKDQNDGVSEEDKFLYT